MKSVHLTNAYHPTSGGIRTWYRQVMDAAGAEGWQVRLIVPAERSGVEVVSDHARIYHIAAPRAPFFDRRYRLILPHRYLRPGSAVHRILLDERPDVLEICDKYALNWLGGLIRKGWLPMPKRPVVVGFSAERMDDNVLAYLGGGALAQRFARTYMRWCYDPMFDVHMAASTYTAEELHAAARSPQPGRVHLQPVGLEVRHFDPARRSPALREALLQRAHGDPDTVLLLYVGRISPEKNIGLLADLARELQNGPGDYRLIVAGSGPLVEWLRHAAVPLDAGRLVLWGQVQGREALAELYATCDMFVHPNPREPFGIAPLEAMASGCPVVLPDAGGVLTYANASNAWLAAPTAQAFAAAVRAVHADPEAARRKAAQARETASAFDTARVVQSLFTTYRQFCATGRT